MSTLQIWNRAEKRLENETVYGEKAMRWAYGTPVGALLTKHVLSRAAFSRAYGACQDLSLSRRKIPDFIRRFSIPMQEFETGPFGSFNEFFIRRFRPGMRSFAAEPAVLPAMAEGRYLAFESMDEHTLLPVKGARLDTRALLGDLPETRSFVGGPGFIARLCPVDYHRFHFPDDGRVGFSRRLTGKLHSVNPIAFESMGDILFTNERHLEILETKHFGRLAYLEVGALCVGKIVQSHDPARPFQRGDEKGYFLFGGSTVILVGEPGSFVPAPDLLEKSRAGIECLVRLGEGIARASGAK